MVTDQSPKSILPLVLSGVVARARKKHLLGPVDLTIGKRGVTIVMGSNGAGKTTLLRVMHGLQRIKAGSVDWAVDESVARRKQAYVFQSPIMMRRRVIDSIAFPLFLNGVAKRSAHKQAEDWAIRVGLAHVLQVWAPMISGGEKQKPALARALIYQPEILFLDEPCANLNGRSTREIEDILTKAVMAGTRIVMATHNIGQARRLANDVVFVCGGKILETTAADVFFDQPKTPEALAFINGEIVE